MGRVSNITFTQVNPGGYTDNATILYGNYSDPTDGAGAFAYYPGSTASTNQAGDVWLNTSVSRTTLPFGSYSFEAILHETGHALGLSHPGLYNAAPGVSITYANNAQFMQDSNQYSVMSYFDESNTGGNDNGYPSTPMLFDIYALQQIYGANMSTRTGDTIYGFGSNAGAVYDFAINTSPAICIWDAGGNDTINCSNYSQTELINLNRRHILQHRRPDLERLDRPRGHHRERDRRIRQRHDHRQRGRQQADRRRRQRRLHRWRRARST